MRNSARRELAATQASSLQITQRPTLTLKATYLNNMVWNDMITEGWKGIKVRISEDKSLKENVVGRFILSSLCFVSPCMLHGNNHVNDRQSCWEDAHSCSMAAFKIWQFYFTVSRKGTKALWDLSWKKQCQTFSCWSKPEHFSSGPRKNAVFL